MSRILLAALLCISFGASAQGLPDFTELVEKQGPTVVNISTCLLYTSPSPRD